MATRIVLKKFVGVMAVAFLWGGLAPESRADAKEDYRRAQAAEQEGDYATAIGIYQALLRQFPQDARLRARLAQAQMAQREGVPKATLEAKLRTVIVPSVEFQDADLDTVFQYLSQKTAELTEGKIQPNFIYKGSAEERKRVNLTLRLSNIPVSELIRYVGDLSGTTFRYEPHAIVGIPLHRVSAESATAEPSAPLAPPR
jgi:hypothetical protein